MTSAWKPLIAPQAMVMNSTGQNTPSAGRALAARCQRETRVSASPCKPPAMQPTASSAMPPISVKTLMKSRPCRISHTGTAEASST